MSKVFTLFCLSMLLALPACSALAIDSTEIDEILKNPAGRWARINIDGGVVYETTALRTLYETRQFEPLWFGNESANLRLNKIRELLLKVDQQGLDPQLYWNSSMEKFNAFGEGLSPIDFELAVSEATLRFARSINVGQVDPSLVDDDIKLESKPFGESEIKRLAAILNGPLEAIEVGLQSFEPQIPLYQHLKSQLAARRSEFKPAELNKIIATMEKLRWLPNNLGDRYGFVNLAMTELQLVEGGTTVLVMKTVNGRPLRRTPMMIDSMARVEINPTWTVPLNLAIWDKLPQIRRDIGFLDRMGIEVYRAGSGTPIEDVRSINWSALSRSYFPYILRQKAGPQNVLGKVKFPLKNDFSIYMHDTDERNLFNESAPRLRSSGCIRLQRPMELAAYLLKNQPIPLGRGWLQSDGTEYPIGSTFTEEILMSRVAKSSQGSKRIPTIGINIDRPLPVYTAYLTADFDAQQGIKFIADAYSQDERLLDILRNRGEGTPQSAPVVSVKNVKMVPLQVNGELGPTQLFGNVIAIRCAVIPYKGCVDFDSKGSQSREEYKFKLNEEVVLPRGYYILGFENTMLPGWLELKCTEDENGECGVVAVNLEKIVVPEEMAQADEIFIYRDLTAVVEKNKILSQSYHNGRPMIQQTPISAKNFYLPGVNQFDVVQRLTVDYCVPILKGKVSGVAPEVKKYCQSLSEVVGMAEYVDLPVVVNDDNFEGTSDQARAQRSMKVFEFPANNDRGRYTMTTNQRWVAAPGNWIDFAHRRYLVAAPLFPMNLIPEQRFVSVLPGQYQILALDKEGKPISQKTIRTQNIDENYDRIWRDLFR